MKKVLLVVTSHNKLGNTGQDTGYYLPEVTHPYFQLLDFGIEVDIASPKGGKAPMDMKSFDLNDPVNKRFVDDSTHMQKIDNTLKLDEVDPKQYHAILFAGGHGTMWDFYPSNTIGNLGAEIYQNGGIVAAVCHGPAALLNIKLDNGDYLVKDKQVAGFSNAEEENIGLSEQMPFLLESELVARGGEYVKAPLWKEKVVVNERLVTGQNPASAEAVGRAIRDLLA